MEPSPERRGRPRRALLAASILVLAGLAGGELSARWLAYRLNRASFAALIAAPPPPAPSGRVRMFDIVRPSPNDRIVYELRPDLLRVPFKGVPLSTDSHGFRSREALLEKPPGEVVVVGIGDSIMFGHGVGDGEPYLSVLAHELAARWPERRWEVINTAVPGYSTPIEVETLRAKGLPFAPDLVLIEFVQNDLELPVWLRAEVDVLDPGRSFLLEAVRARLRPQADEEPAGALVGTPEAISAEVDPERVDLEGFPPGYRDLIGWDAFLRALDELDALRRAHGFEVVAFTLCEFADPVPRMLAEARARGFPVVSMLATMNAWMLEHQGEPLSAEAHARSPLAVDPENAHPSALLHRMAAAEIARALEELGIAQRLLARSAPPAQHPQHSSGAGG